jgi:hypothetical protein
MCFSRVQDSFTLLRFLSHATPLLPIQHPIPSFTLEQPVVAFPTKQLRHDEMNEDGPTICGICLEKRVEGDEVAVLACCHWFDQECVATWLKRSKTCPLCRTVVEP